MLKEETWKNYPKMTKDSMPKEVYDALQKQHGEL